MSETPVVNVGIMSAERSVKITFNGIYSSADRPVITGGVELRLSAGGTMVEMEGRLIPSVVLSPTSPEGDWFEIEGVTIGVDFHWQRQENQRFHGGLKVMATEGKLWVINLVTVEEYLKSVISSEMSATASLNLLRAHAVISRSWLLAQMRQKEKSYRSNLKKGMLESSEEIIRWWDHEDHKFFDVCADDHCQRYQGITRIRSERAVSAVADTAGEVLTDNGQLCDARFSKCCGGIFERYENCWDDMPKSYLVARRDSIETDSYPDLTVEREAEDWIKRAPAAFCNTSDAAILGQVLNNYDRETTDFYRWEVRYSAHELGEIVKERLGENLGDIIGLRPLSRGTSGRIYRLEVIGTLGKKIIGKELMIRRALSRTHLLSSAFTIHIKGDDICLRGAGWGHGVGLCQIGAAVMGEKGYNYKEILKHYYPGGKIERIY